MGEARVDDDAFAGMDAGVLDCFPSDGCIVGVLTFLAWVARFWVDDGASVDGNRRFETIGLKNVGELPAMMTLFLSVSG